MLKSLLAAAVGKSTSQRSGSAGQEAAQETTAALPDYPNRIFIAFMSSWLDPAETLQGIRSVIGEETPIIGCTTAGEITASGPNLKSVPMFKSKTKISLGSM